MTALDNADERNRPARFSMLGADPLYDETFGSWMRRVAAKHNVTRREFVEALIAKHDAAQSNVDIDTIDWDAEPPRWLLDIAQGQAQIEPEQIERLVPWPRSDFLRVEDRGVYCGQCWVKDQQFDFIHTRHEWLSGWCLFCREHGCLLGQLPDPWEDTLQQHVLNDRRRNRSYLDRRLNPVVQVDHRNIHPDTLVVMRRVQNGKLSDALLRKTNGRPDPISELMVLVGSDIEGMSILEWVSYDSNMAWLNGAGDRLPVDGVVAPLGSLRLRIEAMRLAVEIWRWVIGDLCFERREDADIYAGLRQVTVDSPIGRVIQRMLERWSATDRTRWVDALSRPWPAAASISRSRISNLSRE